MKDDPLRAQREHAALFCRQVTEDLSGAIPTTGVTKSDLVAMGQRLWPHGYAHTSNDTEAFERILGYFQTLLETRPDSMTTAIASAFTFLPMEQITMFGASRWADQGFPVVQVGHKYAAALMATSVGPDSVDDIQPPFHCFLIELPRPLLSVWDPDAGRRFSATFVLAQKLIDARGDPVWNFVALTDGKVSLWRHGVPPKDMAEPDVDESLVSWSDYSFGVKADDQDGKTSLLISRLILGVCIAMSNKDNVKTVGRGHSVNAANNRTSPEPLLRRFRVGQPIQLDLRESIRDYLEGRKSTSPTVQTLVRGHWKRQPYGPQASLRKWIWRTPYWRGPEDAPIITRPHQL